MNKKILGTLALLMLLPSFSFAQDDDFGLDLGVGAEKKLAKGVNLEVELGVRTQDNTKEVERWSAGLGLDFKLYSSASKKFDLKASAGWEYIWQNKLKSVEDKFNGAYIDEDTWVPNAWNGYNETSSFWRGRHRTSLGLSAGFKPNKRWSFSWKETVQYNHYCTTDSIDVFKYRKQYNDDNIEINPKEEWDKKVKDARDRFVLRSKFSAQYDIKRCPLAPFASVDYGCGLNYTANKWKFSAGSDFKIDKQNKLTFYYRFQTEDDDDEPNGHIIGLGYNHKF